MSDTVDSNFFFSSKSKLSRGSSLDAGMWRGYLLAEGSGLARSLQIILSALFSITVRAYPVKCRILEKPYA